jgi:hypothetical protein
LSGKSLATHDGDLGDALEDLSEDQESHELAEVELLRQEVVEELDVLVACLEFLQAVKQVDQCLVVVNLS